MKKRQPAYEPHLLLLLPQLGNNYAYWTPYKDKNRLKAVKSTYISSLDDGCV
ncbi:hypothetical protein [Paenibacillus alginolyticus]|uniref:hypothetical protein n=1 Tax=Paenibacillus alginolyticus TaxID=59839 RepID=UPI000416ADAD|nr:hypothetical protein [Paenibacillus alginolyticus]MEC0147997.1 hypothetical protein [Paenibacillus alginolyticus]